MPASMCVERPVRRRVSSDTFLPASMVMFVGGKVLLRELLLVKIIIKDIRSTKQDE